MASGLQFEDLMSKAENNVAKAEKKIRHCNAPQYNLAPPKPKKLSPKEKQLSDGVRKFLQRKEEEERRRMEEEKEKKQNLLQLRRQDKKAGKRVSSMLRMTKSANKACMADARDSFSDSLAQQGEFQPDEDDYGYVSQYSQEMHKKLLDKYKQTPVSKPTASRSAAPLPVPHTLTKHRQKPTEDYDDVNDDADSYRKEPMDSNVKKKKVPPPEALNFQALLELANQKSQQPVQMKPKVAPVKEKEVYEFGRPMTAKEKAAYLKEKALKERVRALHESPGPNKSGTDVKPPGANTAASFKIPSMKKKDAPSSTPITSSSSSSSSLKNTSSDLPGSKVPKKNHDSGRGSIQNIPPNASQRSSLGTPKPQLQKKPMQRSSDPPRGSLSSTKAGPTQEKPISAKKPTTAREPEKKLPPKPISRPPPSDKPHISPSRSSSTNSGSSSSKVDPRSQSLTAKPSSSASQSKIPNDHHRQPQRSSEPSRPNPRPPSSKVPPERRSSPPRRKMPPPGMGHRPMHRPQQRPMKRRVIESDEEYDSEMDDFIDDDEGDQVDISSLIRDIYGYDKNRYRGMDDEDIEESSWAEQRKEEARSARLGLMEDLEDMRKEEEENRRKMLARKKMRR